jgi:transcriptional regulator GlxA family with amidase domain
MDALKLSPDCQLIAAQCSGVMILARLGLIDGFPVTTDTNTMPYLRARGIEVVDVPLCAHGNIVTAGGCLASHYLAAWILTRTHGVDVANDVVRYAAPVGEKDDYVSRASAQRWLDTNKLDAEEPDASDQFTL